MAWHASNVLGDKEFAHGVCLDAQMFSSRFILLGLGLRVQNSKLNDNTNFSKLEAHTFVKTPIVSFSKFSLKAKMPLNFGYSEMKGLDKNDYLIKNYKGISYGLGLFIEPNFSITKNHVISVLLGQEFTWLNTIHAFYQTVGLSYKYDFR